MNGYVLQLVYPSTTPSTDGMTADSFPFDHEFLTLCAGRIINEVRGVRT